MVLQQGASLPIWGEADPGEQVTVTFVGQQVTTTARADRQWRVHLQPVYLRSSPDVLTVDGKNHLVFSDVLVGDVWLCCGQSNMAFPLWEADGGEIAIAHAQDEQLRLFVVPEKRALHPQFQLEGQWERCSSETAKSFSAVGYFFGRDLRMATQMPIGLIGSYCGGSSAQAWMSLTALKESPSFSHYLAQYHQIERDFPKNNAIYSTQKIDYEEKLATWEKEVGTSYEEELTVWKIQCKEACSKLRAQPLKPEPLFPKPIPPLSPDGGVTAPTMLFNGMIAPLIPYAMTGVIWYQGSANENKNLLPSAAAAIAIPDSMPAFLNALFKRIPTTWGSSIKSIFKKDTEYFMAPPMILPAVEYRRLFQRLIRSWRIAWGEGPFPFYFVSLAGFRNTSFDPVDMLVDDEGNLTPGWPWLREGQVVARSLPETGMALATDIGHPHDIHPKDKLDVGRRLALLARHQIYGQEVMARGPTYRNSKQEGAKIRFAFDHVGHGLTVAAPPWRYDGAILVPHSLQGFAIAGADRHWYEASAVIEGADVIVSSEFVSKPTAVRYNWKDNPIGNLYNKEGLPAEGFRTDQDQPR